MTITAEGLRSSCWRRKKDFLRERRRGAKRRRQAGHGHAGQRVGQLPNKITIEGHTDAKPYVSNIGYSNWELSADRANGARK